MRMTLSISAPETPDVWVVAFLTTGDEIVTHIAIVCIQIAELLLVHRQTRWINNEAALVSRSVIAVDAGVEESCVRSVLRPALYIVDRH